MPLATSSHRVMPPKMLTRIARTFSSVLITSIALASTFGVGAAADVEEVGRRAADLVDDVEGAHDEPRAVADDADACRRGRCS